MSKRKSPPQSLYEGPNRAPTIEELRKWGPLTRREQFLETLKESKVQADLLEKLKMQRGPEYAARFRAVSHVLEMRINGIDRADDPEAIYDALMWAFDLGMWRALARSDAQFAHAVRQHENMLKGKGFVRAKRPDNETISNALRNSATRAEAAETLGVSDRTLRRWINEE